MISIHSCFHGGLFESLKCSTFVPQGQTYASYEIPLFCVMAIVGENFCFVWKNHTHFLRSLTVDFLTSEIYFGLITSYWVKMIQKCQEGVTDKNLVIDKFEIYVNSKTESDNLSIMHPIVITIIVLISFFAYCFQFVIIS